MAFDVKAQVVEPLEGAITVRTLVHFRGRLLLLPVRHFLWGAKTIWTMLETYCG